MANIVPAYKRLMAVGCSHGKFIDPLARDAVVRFRERYKPAYCIHLGDFIDTTSFRAGARGTGDESEDIDDDLDAGLDFLKALRPTHLTLGNHDWRVWKHLEDRNAQVRKAAKDVVASIEATTKWLKCETYEYRGVWSYTERDAILQIGNYKFAHGSFYGENATRDYAERFGNVVHAHTHRAAMAKGRRSDSPTAYGSGCLMLPTGADYAMTRAATLAWSMGIIYGEVAMRRRAQCYLVLAERPRGADEWRIPA